MVLTILTPTYNRGGNLKELFNSLKSQTCKDFDWLIVDDGSCDDTKQIVESFTKSCEMFEIKYIYKNNGGKHTALNIGLDNILTELTMIVDSDDILTHDCVQTILEYNNKYCNDDTLCGYSFLRGYPDGSVNGKPFYKNELIDSYINTRINSNDTNADKAEVFKTKCLKEFPFPEFDGEKFLGEDIVWVRMARKYKMLHINKIIYIGNYLSDGLTNNRRIHNIKSPNGNVARAKEFMRSDICFKIQLKANVQYIIYSKFVGFTNKHIIKNSPNKFFTIILLIPSFLLYLKWKHTYC